MRKITKHIPARTSTSYQCGICKIKYSTAKKAMVCEAMPTEEKSFKPGDRVRWRELCTCSAYDKTYYLHGIIVKVLGPTLPDFEYNAKWLGGVLSGMHAFMYLVKWKCTFCHDDLEQEFYSIELKKIKTR